MQLNLLLVRHDSPDNLGAINPAQFDDADVIRILAKEFHVCNRTRSVHRDFQG